MSVCLCVSVSVSVVNSFVDSSVVVVDSNSELEIVSRTRRIKAAPPCPPHRGISTRLTCPGLRMPLANLPREADIYILPQQLSAPTQSRSATESTYSGIRIGHTTVI